MIYKIILGTVKTAIFLIAVTPCVVIELICEGVCFFGGIGDGFVLEDAWEWFKEWGISTHSTQPSQEINP